MEILDPLWILTFDHNGYLGSDPIKWIVDLTNVVLVDSFLGLPEMESSYVLR